MIHILCFEKTADIKYGGLMLKRITFALIMGVIVNLTVNAAMVSFYVIETGLNEEADVQQSILWENAFLDVFFDAGYIISNAPLLRLENKPSDILQVVDIKEAGTVGIDYMLIVLLDYNVSLLTPNEIYFYIYKVSGQKIIKEKKMAAPQARAARDEYENIKSIARGFIPYIGE
jgi:hypothetical protein